MSRNCGVVSTQGRLLVAPDPSFLHCFWRPKRSFRLKPELLFLQKGAWRLLVAFWRWLPAAGTLRGPQNRWIFESAAQKWPMFADFVVCRLVLTFLKVKRVRVWAPGVHQRAFRTKTGSENPFWARAAAPKSQRTAGPGEIACHGGAGIAV